MVIQAAFIPDAIPAAAMQTGMAGAAAAPGAGVFQQLLQGKQPNEAKGGDASAKKGTEGQTSAASGATETAEPAKADGSSVGTGSARNGLPAAAAQSMAPQKAAVATGKVQLPVQWAALRNELAEQSAGEAAATELTAEPATDGSGTETASETGTGEEVAALPQDPTSADDVPAAVAVTVPAAEMRPDPTPGLAVATAAVASNMERRSDGANPEAGAQALSRLKALQEQAHQAIREQQVPREPQAADAEQAQPEAKALAVEQGQTAAKALAVEQHNVPSGIAAGSRLGQEAEPAKLTRQNRGAEVSPSTGATERAQVEVPKSAQATRADRKELPSQAAAAQAPATAAKTAVSADQAVAAAHLSAKQTGEGRFVAMPVRDLSASTEQQTATVEPATSATTAAEQPVQIQDPQVVAGTTTAADTVVTTGADTGASLAGVQAEEVAVQGKAKTQEELAAAKQEQQAEPVQLSKEEVDQAADKAQQRRDLRHGEGLPDKPVREAEQAQQGGVAKLAGDEVSGTKSASVATAKLVPEQGTVSDASGARGEQGQSQQKGQEQQNAQLAGAGVMAQGSAAAEPGQAEIRQAGTRSPLHESILSQVREGVVTHDGKGNGQMSIRLNPGELGELKIQVRMEDNRFKVEVQADSRMVKDLLMSNLDSLKDALSGKNLTMDGFNVSTGGGGFNGPLNEEKGNQRQHSSPRFARGAGYEDRGPAQVNYLTAEVNNLLDVRF